MTKPKSKAAAARAEKEQESRSVEWKGIVVTLPAELPDAVLLDLALVQGSEDASASFQMLMTMIGEPQYLQIRNMLKREEVELTDVAELIRAIFEEYGTNEGELEASQDS